MASVIHIVEKQKIKHIASTCAHHRVFEWSGPFRAAPPLGDGMIVSWLDLSWRNFPFLVSLRAANPTARIVNMSRRSQARTTAETLLSALFDDAGPGDTTPSASMANA